MRFLNSPSCGVESCIAPPRQRLLFGFAFLGSFLRAAGLLSSFAFLSHVASPPFKVTCGKWYRSEPTCQNKSSRFCKLFFDRDRCRAVNFAPQLDSRATETRLFSYRYGARVVQERINRIARRHQRAPERSASFPCPCEHRPSVRSQWVSVRCKVARADEMVTTQSQNCALVPEKRRNLAACHNDVCVLIDSTEALRRSVLRCPRAQA